IYDANIHQGMASSYGNHDAGTCARWFSALSLALAGEEERACTMADSSLAAARGLDDPFSLALSLYFASATAQVLDDGSRAFSAFHALSPRIVGESAYEGRASCRCNESRRRRDRAGRQRRRTLLYRGTPSAAGRAVGASAARPDTKGGSVVPDRHRGRET